MQNGYEARDSQETAWLNDAGRPQDVPSSVPGPPAMPFDNGFGAPPHTGGADHRMPAPGGAGYGAPRGGAPEYGGGDHTPGYGGGDHARPGDGGGDHARPGDGGGDHARPDHIRSGDPDGAGDTVLARGGGLRADVERAVPAGQQLRESLGRMASAVRRSVPLRTILFLLPPLALPPLAFELSVGATIVVALTLVWLAAAAGVFCTLMLEGGDHVALRSIEHRLAPIADGEGGGSRAPSPAAGDDSLQEALVAIGAQLDALDERVAALGTAAATPPNDDLKILSDRPEEHWSNTSQREQYDRYGQPAVPDTNWGESRWRR